MFDYNYYYYYFIIISGVVLVLAVKVVVVTYTVDSRYLDLGYLEQPLISKRKSDPCFRIEF